MTKERKFMFAMAVILIVSGLLYLNQAIIDENYIKISDIQNYSETICIASYPRQTILECPCDNMNITRCQKSPIIKVATTDLARDYEGFVIKGECRIANITFEQRVSVYDCNLNVSDPLISTLELNLTLQS